VLNKKIKKDLIKDITLKTGLSSNVSKKIFNDLVNILIQNIKKGSLVLKNVGSFKIVEKKKRKGRNTKTKKEIINKFTIWIRLWDHSNFKMSFFCHIFLYC